MNAIKSFVRGVDAFSERFGKFFSWILLSLMILTCFEVFTRRVLGAPTIWTLETSMYIFSAVCMLALGYTQLHKAHANVDIFYQAFPRKWKAVCNIITFVFFMGLFSVILMVWGGIFFYDSVSILEKSPSAFNAPKYPSKLMMPIGGFLLFIQAFADIIRDVFFLIKGEEL